MSHIGALRFWIYVHICICTHAHSCVCVFICTRAHTAPASLFPFSAPPSPHSSFSFLLHSQPVHIHVYALGSNPVTAPPTPTHSLLSTSPSPNSVCLLLFLLFNCVSTVLYIHVLIYSKPLEWIQQCIYFLFVFSPLSLVWPARRRPWRCSPSETSAGTLTVWTVKLRVSESFVLPKNQKKWPNVSVVGQNIVRNEWSKSMGKSTTRFPTVARC